MTIKLKASSGKLAEAKINKYTKLSLQLALYEKWGCFQLSRGK